MLIVIFIIFPFIINSIFGVPAIGKPAPDFTLIDIEGNTFKLSNQFGKVVLLDFFATWWGPCKTMIPILQELREDFNSIIILSIDVDAAEDVDMLRDFGAEYNIT